MPSDAEPKSFDMPFQLLLPGPLLAVAQSALVSELVLRWKQLLLVQLLLLLLISPPLPCLRAKAQQLQRLGMELVVKHQARLGYLWLMVMTPR